MRHLALLALVLFVPLADAAALTVHAGTGLGGQLYFSPRELRARQGDDVTLTIVNDDEDQPHDWALLSYGGQDIEAFVGPGASKTITFEAHAVGTYRVVCQVVGHKQAGMEGTFVVEKKGLPAPGMAAVLVAISLVGIQIRRHE